jgi:hypothetical protein
MVELTSLTDCIPSATWRLLTVVFAHSYGVVHSYIDVFSFGVLMRCVLHIRISSLFGFPPLAEVFRIFATIITHT